MDSWSERQKLTILGFLLLLMLAFLAFTSSQTLQAVGSFQQRSRAVKAGDVSTVRPWMTVHAISHIYHVPEDFLYHELHISNPIVMRHVTLNGIAMERKQPLTQVIHTVQSAIMVYRKTHPRPFPSPTARPPTPPKTRSVGAFSELHRIKGSTSSMRGGK
ncbi:MAG TPA: hypothetical protein VFN23_00535 [Ktedonobacteraceae bacterium]|nr:hypothetical protein [Ktedonobacteraceae bacterium]